MLSLLLTKASLLFALASCDQVSYYEGGEETVVKHEEKIKPVSMYSYYYYDYYYYTDFGYDDSEAWWAWFFIVFVLCPLYGCYRCCYRNAAQQQQQQRHGQRSHNTGTTTTAIYINNKTDNNYMAAPNAAIATNPNLMYNPQMQ